MKDQLSNHGFHFRQGYLSDFHSRQNYGSKPCKFGPGLRSKQPENGGLMAKPSFYSLQNYALSHNFETLLQVLQKII